MIKKIEISIAQALIDDLKTKIKLTRWPDEIENSYWNFGASLSYMKELTDYWTYYFDWRKTERDINKYENYIATIDGIRIHFLHIKGKGDNRVPLILTHGWPYSFLEMLKLIPLLEESDKMSFDLIIPSMPGYGFSQRITQPGCNVTFIGELWHKLMTELGYEKYAVHGGDFGAGVSTSIAMQYPEHVIGLHINYIPGNYVPVLQENDKFTDEENEYLDKEEEWYSREGGYSLEQNTKPLTLAYGLNDSPVGLCAWIVEKMYGWSNNSGYIGNVFTKDELLSNVTLYWLTETIHSSCRLYNENSKNPLIIGEESFINTPVGIAHFRYEDPFPPRKFIERGFNIQHWTDFPLGGHFPAMEKPEELAKDIIAFLSKIMAPAATEDSMPQDSQNDEKKTEPQEEI
jgi:pimeloyl-ACP methyl ester carboxylesterase